MGCSPPQGCLLRSGCHLGREGSGPSHVTRVSRGMGCWGGGGGCAPFLGMQVGRCSWAGSGHRETLHAAAFTPQGLGVWGPKSQGASSTLPARKQLQNAASSLASRFDTEPPKIRVPRHLRQTYIRQVGEPVNLQIPFEGTRNPQASWTHNGHALDSQRVSVRSGAQDSILFIRSAQRADSGRYELTLRLEGLEAKAAVDILVIEKPGPPSSIQLLEVWGCNAALQWTPPQDTGNAELLGYTVQKADRKTGKWFTVLERYHPTTCTISDLIMGNAYYFRVFSENLCGLSDSAAVTKELAHIQKADIIAKPKGFVERDFSEAPSFTQPLADHTFTPGYSTQLFCSVRASPKPKIVWMKNQVDVQGDPKYRALSDHGVCTLEIRKPGPFDSGVYTCKAVNVLGEASVDCRLEVKASATH